MGRKWGKYGKHTHHFMGYHRHILRTSPHFSFLSSVFHCTSGLLQLHRRPLGPQAQSVGRRRALAQHGALARRFGEPWAELGVAMGLLGCAAHRAGPGWEPVFAGILGPLWGIGYKKWI